MAKQQAEKKEFAWDSEVKIGEYNNPNYEKERHEVKICTLNGKTFVVDTKLVNKAATGWTPVKNTTFELGAFEQVYEMVSNWKLKDAFGGETPTVGKKKGGRK